jgi:uncharacterized protein YegJ (DUF2314 family)
MRFPFLRSANTDQTVIPLEPMVTLGFGVFFDATGYALPTTEELTDMARTWLDTHADDPFRDALKEFVSRMVTFNVREKSQLHLPPMELLQSMGLGELEKQCLTGATHGVQIIFSDALRHPQFGLHAGLASSYGIAKALKGVVYDPQRYRILGASENDRRLPGDGMIAIFRHIAVAFSPDANGLGIMSTVGMDKFGLPNLELRDIPRNLVKPLGPFVHGVAQWLVMAVHRQAEGSSQPPADLRLGPEIRIGAHDIAAAMGQEPRSSPEGVRGWTTCALRFLRPLPGMKQLLAITPPGNLKIQQGVWLNTVMNDLQHVEDRIAAVKTGSETMEIAHRRAMDELPRIRQRFQAGLEPGDVLYVKHGFPTGDDGNEFMWIVVNAWTGDKITGTLANEPRFLTNIRAGETVRLSEADVFDWLLMRRDGSREGGYTSEIAMREGTE